MHAHSLSKSSHLNSDSVETLVEVSLENRDRLALKFQLTADGEVVNASLTGTGCSALLSLLQEFRPKLRGKLIDLEIPEVTNHAAILMRELLLKAKGEWKFPFAEEEICHCRGIATARVDQAIIGGCHSVESVKRATSAGSSCGTCRYDVESIIKYRLQKS